MQRVTDINSAQARKNKNKMTAGLTCSCDVGGRWRPAGAGCGGCGGGLARCGLALCALEGA